MTKTELQKLSNYFLKRFFGGIPKVNTVFEELEEDEFGNFVLEANDDFDLSEEDPVYAKLLEEAPEYRNRDFVQDNLTITRHNTPSFTDPACHPNIVIRISDSIKRKDLVVVGTLLHELTHYYCWYLGFDYHDGNRQFEMKLREFGFPSNFDRNFNKETKEWNDAFDYSCLKKYLDEFKKVL